MDTEKMLQREPRRVAKLCFFSMLDSPQAVRDKSLRDHLMHQTSIIHGAMQPATGRLSEELGGRDVSESVKL